MEAKRLEKDEMSSETEDGWGKLSDEDIKHMIDTDPEVKRKAIELIEDQSLTEEERTDQIADFINKKNKIALDEMINSIKKGPKKKGKPSKSQVTYGMKKYLCHQANWKMYQLKGKSHEEIEVLYYTAFRRSKIFIPMGTEKETLSLKRACITLESKIEKKQKTVTQSCQANSKEGERLTKAQFEEMITIDPKILNEEPLQAKYPIISWEIYSDAFGEAWKINRVGGMTGVYKDFEDLV